MDKTEKQIEKLFNEYVEDVDKLEEKDWLVGSIVSHIRLFLPAVPPRKIRLTVKSLMFRRK